jgi:hypothetical protein
MLIVEGSRVYYLPCSTAMLQIQHPDGVLPPLPQLTSLELPQTMTHSNNSIECEGLEKSSQDIFTNEGDKADADGVRASEPIEEGLRYLGMVIGNSREYV